VRRGAIVVALAALASLSGAAVAQDDLPKKLPPKERTNAFAKLPYWDGLWQSAHLETTIGGLSVEMVAARERGETWNRNAMQLTGFGAPWNEEGKARQAERMKTGGNRKANGWGYPMMMNSNAPIQFLVTPEEVMIINAYRDVRYVYTDGRKHPSEEDRWPTAWGDSTGRWEGDTLVIDTIGVKNPNIYFHGAPPLSEDAHYVERLRMTGPDMIEGEITITDPKTLTQPWTLKLAYTRAKGFDRMISIEYENDRTGFDGTSNTIEPDKVP
jgi:hypothetical protein